MQPTPNPDLNSAQDNNRRMMKTITSLLLPLYFPSLLFATARSLLIPVLPLYASDFQISYTLIGILLSADKIGMLAGDIPAGMLIRRLGIKRAMLLGILMAMVFTTALFWAVSIYDAFVYLFLSGFGTSLYAVTRHTWIVEAIPMAQRGRAISLLGGVFRIGNFIGPVAGGAIAAAFGLRVPFLFFGLAYLASLVANAVFLPRVMLGQGKDLDQRLTFRNFKQMFGDQASTVTWAGAGYLFMQMVRSGPSIIIPLYAANILGLDVRSIGLIMSLASAVDMTLFLPAGFIMDRFGRKISIVSSSLVLSIGIALIPITSGFNSLMLVAMLIGFGNGLGSGTMLVLGADLAPEKLRGEFLGIWRLLGDAGSTGGPLAIGGVAEAFSLGQTSFAIAAAGIAASLVFTFIVKETLASSRSKKIPKPAG